MPFVGDEPVKELREDSSEDTVRLYHGAEELGEERQGASVATEVGRSRSCGAGKVTQRTLAIILMSEEPQESIH